MPRSKATMSSQPARMGLSWNDEETQQLLVEVKQLKSIAEISELHERTTGSIRARLRYLAYCYYKEGKPLEQIQQFTGLDISVIEKTIHMHQLAEKPKPSPPKDILSQILLKLEELSAQNAELTRKVDSLLAERTPQPAPKKFIVIPRSRAQHAPSMNAAATGTQSMSTPDTAS